MPEVEIECGGSWCVKRYSLPNVEVDDVPTANVGAGCVFFSRVTFKTLGTKVQEGKRTTTTVTLDPESTLEEGTHETIRYCFLISSPHTSLFYGQRKRRSDTTRRRVRAADGKNLYQGKKAET